MNDYVVKLRQDGGAGFDATWNDGVRDSVRGAIGAASAGTSAQVAMDAIANAVQSTALENRWRAVQSVENHDIDRAAAACGQDWPPK